MYTHNMMTSILNITHLNTIFTRSYLYTMDIRDKLTLLIKILDVVYRSCIESSKFVLDVILIITLIGFILIELKFFNYISIECFYICMYLYVSITIYILIVNITIFMPNIGIIFSSFSFLINGFEFVTCNQQDISSVYIFIIATLCCSAVITVYTIRNNLLLGPPIKCDMSHIIEYIRYVFSNKHIALTYVFGFIVCISTRHYLFTNLSFAISLNYFTLYYLIIFSTWLPTSYVFKAVINLLGVKCDTSNTSHFNLQSLNTMFFFSVISFTCKSTFFLYAIPLCLGLKNLEIIKIIYLLKPSSPIIQGKPIASIPAYIGTQALVFGSQTTDSEESRINIDQLKPNKNYPNHHLQWHNALLVPKNMNLNIKENLEKQIERRASEVRILDTPSSKNSYRLTYLKRMMSHSLNKQQKNMFEYGNAMSPSTITNYTFFTWKNFNDSLYDARHRPKEEFKLYGFMNTMLYETFVTENAEKDMTVNPQAGETHGLVDFSITRGRGQGKEFLCVIESKALKSKYSYTQLYTQALQYARHNNFNENCYIIINKGTFISFGIYSEDFHTTNAPHFDKKYIEFDGYIGLMVDSNYNVMCVPQKNKPELQHKLYEIKMWNAQQPNIEQTSSILTLLNYIRDNDPNHTPLRWGTNSLRDTDNDHAIK